MNSGEIRQIFLQFFQEKAHQLYPSAPIVVKNDPTLMFTNAGMNQFKDWFLGNEKPAFNRVANSQKCLRVSGKHNDLEEVGVDHYHHTMFEMLGNWSFGNYFKQDAIQWAWELLTEKFNLDKNRMYVTVFEGDTNENLSYDQESFDIWSALIQANRILNGNKKDNFWEMGDTGPCGPCSEIHYDMRSDKDRNLIDGSTLVNQDHPEVIEIWNLVFMEFNRKADGSLVPLPAKHVDTGMGFERLCRVIQEKKSNYDTDVFSPLLSEIARLTNKTYEGTQSKKDIAFRVIADHIRTIAFTLADGQLPSSNGAGYVVRRILRRAVRYAYSFLDTKSPVLFQLIPLVAEQFKTVFPEVKVQEQFIAKVIQEEENAFLRTLEKGLDHLQVALQKNSDNKPLDGQLVFELYDTFGFPLDLTRLIASENNQFIDEPGFNDALNKQKERSRADAQKETGDWINVQSEISTRFLGYDKLTCEADIIKYRSQVAKGKTLHQVVLNYTPFYPEGGGQVGDTGFIIGQTCGKSYPVVDTKKENNLIIHLLPQLPENVNQTFTAKVNTDKRTLTTRNHSATHLLHAALRQVLGKHVAQKGSLVNDAYLRFDFSHFAKLTDEEIESIESLVNEQISKNIALKEEREISIDDAMAQGAMALFGEKYGEKVRMICFDPQFSIELCGGTHVKQTAEIGIFKIVSESAVAAGVRRIEAISSKEALTRMNSQEQTLAQLQALLNKPKDIPTAVQKLQEELTTLKNQLSQYEIKEIAATKQQLLSKFEQINGLNVLVSAIDIPHADALKDLCFQLRNNRTLTVGILGSIVQNKPILAVFTTDDISEKRVHAAQVIKQISKHIQGGGGGQAFFATAGGSNPSGLNDALNEGLQFLKSIDA